MAHDTLHLIGGHMADGWRDVRWRLTFTDRDGRERTIEFEALHREAALALLEDLKTALTEKITFET